MTSGIQRRRSAKAQRRKSVLTARRHADCGDPTQPLAKRVRHAASEPIFRSLVADRLFEQGIGPVTLVRGPAGGNLAVAVFLVDTFCLGVKDAFFRAMPGWDLEMLLERMSVTTPMSAVDPCHARKLLRDAARYAAELGQKPHRDFRAIEPLFGDVRAEDCEADFTFGYEGKPLYVPGPTESPTLISARLSQLRGRLDEDGFRFFVPCMADEDMEADHEERAYA